MANGICTLRTRNFLAALLGITLAAAPAAAQRRVWFVQHENSLDYLGLAEINGTHYSRGNAFGGDKITGIAFDSNQAIATSTTNSGSGAIYHDFGAHFSSSTLRPKYLVQGGLSSSLFFYDSVGHDIYRIENNFTGLVQIFPNALNVTSLAIDTVSAYLFWSDGNGPAALIHRINLDGSGHIAASAPLANVVAVDENTNVLFVSTALVGSIQRWTYALSLAGTPFPNGTNPSYMATDGLGKIYWSNTTNGTIKRANTDGTNIETILSGRTIPADSPIATEIGPTICEQTVPYGDQDFLGTVNISDIAQVVNCFKGVAIGIGSYEKCDVYPCALFGGNPACMGDGTVNISDVAREVDIFKEVHVVCP